MTSKTGNGKDPQATSELNAAMWSVISFSNVEGSGLTYSKAAEMLAELESGPVAGLCIVTDAAAARLDPLAEV